MQILGKKSKVLLMVIAIAMLIAVGASFAMWDMSAVKATNGDLSDYANAKVGDIVSFGRYYQTEEKDLETGEYVKTNIEWLVIDKNERTGELTLMSKYILAIGSYFGNYYLNSNGEFVHYDLGLVGQVESNQAYGESTIRAFLNNLERRDLGGDEYIDGMYMPSNLNSTPETGLLTSVGYSNSLFFAGDYVRDIKAEPYVKRPALRGFYDEAFNWDEKSLIVPKVISGYTGFRWPSNNDTVSNMSYVEGAVDKVWIASAIELGATGNVANSSDAASACTYEYFKNYEKYLNPFTGEYNKSLMESRCGMRSPLLSSTSTLAGNYSVPMYLRGTTDINTDISPENHKLNYYWTRTPMSRWHFRMQVVSNTGGFDANMTGSAGIGARPCLILKY